MTNFSFDIIIETQTYVGKIPSDANGDDRVDAFDLAILARN
jgi:hypothetical protein